MPQRRDEVAGGRRGSRGQSGQALIYGLFVLAGGLAALFFLFNAGQLSSEKTKLVNTADAVAYSAGVMQARALNYLAYTNRALIANEVAVAQAVSLVSWARYEQEHGASTIPLNCGSWYSYPIAKAWIRYEVLCATLYSANNNGSTKSQTSMAEGLARVVIPSAEIIKAELQASQLLMQASLLPARTTVMREVARANYRGDGEIEVDAVPLMDTYTSFDGEAFVARYDGNQRERFAEVTQASAQRDAFLRSRQWRDDSLIPSPCYQIGQLKFDYVDRHGGTQLDGYKDWSTSDRAAMHEHYISVNSLGIPRCRVRTTPLADQDARASDFGYRGLPAFHDLSAKARAYTLDAADPDKRDPRPRFAIRITRGKPQTRTSDARSQIGASQDLNSYQGQPAKDVYASVSGAEVYFDRPRKRSDGNEELANLFNPYWQVRLIDVASQLAAARALQGVAAP